MTNASTGAVRQTWPGPPWLQVALGLALLYFPVCGLAGLPFGNGGRYANVLAGPIALLYLLFGFRRQWLELAAEGWRFLAPFAPFLAACLLVLLVQREAEVGDPFSRVLWTVPIVLAASRIGLTRASVYSAAAVGALFYLGAALFDIQVRGAPRAGAAVNEVIFAQTASLCTGLAFICSVCERHAPRLLRAGWLAAGVAGLLAVAMSGSRGPLLAMLLLVLLVGTTAWRRGQRRLLPVALLAIVAAIAVASAVTPLGGRLRLTAQEVEAYYSAVTPPITSIGIRLELWRIALTSLPDHWLFGYGYSTLEELATRLPALQFLPESLREVLHHFHADWAHAVMAGGLVLLAGLVATIVALLRQSWQDPARSWLVGAMLIFGLTDIAFFRKPTLTLFIASYGLLLATRHADPNASPDRPVPG